MKVLIATDGSQSAAAAVDFAATFPFPDDTSFTLLSVSPRIEHRAEALDNRHHAALDATQAAALAEAHTFVQEHAEILDEAGRSHSTLVRTGHPAEEIVMAAEETAADIIVVGSLGRTAAKRFLMGSVSSQVLRSAHCSVLIVKESKEAHEGRRLAPPHGRHWRLLVAYDDSIQAKQAIEFCASLATSAATEVEILTVLPVVTMFRQDIGQELSEVWRQSTATDKAALAAAAAAIDSTTAHVTTSLVQSGDVSDAILDAGDRIDADVIIMGDKGKGSISRFLMGSATHQVVHHAHRSVLTIRARVPASIGGDTPTR